MYYKETYKCHGIGKIIQELSVPYKGKEKQKIQFVIPIKEGSQQKLTDNITSAAQPIKRLQKIISNSDEMSIKYHNEMIKFLNHSNERR